LISFFLLVITLSMSIIETRQLTMGGKVKELGEKSLNSKNLGKLLIVITEILKKAVDKNEALC